MKLICGMILMAGCALGQLTVMKVERGLQRPGELVVTNVTITGVVYTNDQTYLDTVSKAGSAVQPSTATNIAKAVIAPYTNSIATALQNPYSATNWTWTSDGTQITLASYRGPNAVIIPDMLDNLPVTSLGTSLSTPGPITRITSISGGANIGNIGEAVFQTCSSLQSVTLNGVTNIADGAFFFCSGLTNLVMPSLQTIGVSALNTTALRSLILPNIRSIGTSAFGKLSGTSYLTNMVLYANAPTVGSTIFSGVPANQVTIYVTNPTATGYGSTLGGMPVVRMGGTFDSVTLGGETRTNWPTASVGNVLTNETRHVVLNTLEVTNGIRTAGNVLSVSPVTRELYDSDGHISLDWTGRSLTDGSFGLSLDWANRYLSDHDQIASVDWDNRTLQYNNYELALDWGTSNQFKVGGSLLVNGTNIMTTLAGKYDASNPSNYLNAVDVTNAIASASSANFIVRMTNTKLTGFTFTPTNATYYGDCSGSALAANAVVNVLAGNTGAYTLAWLCTNTTFTTVQGGYVNVDLYGYENESGDQQYRAEVYRIDRATGAESEWGDGGHTFTIPTAMGLTREQVYVPSISTNAFLMMVRLKRMGGTATNLRNLYIGTGVGTPTFFSMTIPASVPIDAHNANASAHSNMTRSSLLWSAVGTNATYQMSWDTSNMTFKVEEILP